MVTKKNENTLDRRDFVIKSALYASFALAVQPVAHSVILTDTEGLEVNSDVLISTGKDKMPAYYAMPNGAGPFPAILVVHEIFGVHEHIKDVCRRLAKLGFFAIAPYLFFRENKDVQKMTIPDILKEVVSKITTKGVNADLDATLNYMQTLKKVKMSALNIVGFCWGGKTVWLYAAHNPKLKSGIAWYGSLVGVTPEQPEAAVDIAPRLKVPVLGLYGGKDDYITIDHLNQMNKSLSKGKSKSKIVTFENAKHGFYADYRESYKKDDADKAFDLMLEWIKKQNGR